MSLINTTIQLGAHNRSNIDMSNYHVTTTDFGRLDVVYHTQLVPGDDLSASFSSFLRAAPMAVPTFGSVRLNLRAFFVPYRIMYNEPYYFNKFVTKADQRNPSMINTSVLNTWMNSLGIPNEHEVPRILSQLGIPVEKVNSLQIPRISAHPLYAYYRIWYDYYRDSNINPDDAYPLTTLSPATFLSTSDLAKLLPHYCTFNKDPYTSCMLSPQSGEPSAVHGYKVDASRTTPSYGLSDGVKSDTQSTPLGFDFDNGMNSSLTIRSIRAAEALQRFLERNNIAGGRAIQRFLLRYGNKTRGENLGMCQYLGGTSYEMQVGDITTNNTPLNSAPSTPFELDLNKGTYNGQLSGKAAVAGNSNPIKFHADEFGEFMVISTLVPITGYYQGIDPQLTIGVNGADDFFQPEYENIGYEPVYTSELYFDSGSSSSIFGFRPRYSQYKFKRNVVSSDFQNSNTNVGYNSYHLFREFISTPSLSDDFNYITPANRHQLDRIFTVNGSDVAQYDHFLGQHHCNVNINRPMSNEVLPELETENHSKINVETGGNTL